MRTLLVFACVAMTACGLRREEMTGGGGGGGEAAGGGSATGGGSAAGGGTSALPLSCDTPLGTELCELTLAQDALDPGIDVVMSQNQPGQHFACRPNPVSAFNGKLLLHLVGTGSDPYRDNRVLEHACSLGFAAVGPMYENAHDARSVCGDDGGCYEDFHRGIVEGGDVRNSILTRAQSILERMPSADPDFTSWAALRDSFIARDFSRTVFTGHSQGGGHALWLGRDFSAERVIMFSSVNDRLSSGTTNNAVVPWVASYSTDAKTPPSRVLGYSHKDDSIGVFTQTIDNWTQLGMDPTECDYVSVGGYAAGCRRIETMSPSCLTGLDAHDSTILVSFGAGCVEGGTLYSNRPTWTFLLTTPLP
jgi:hypothetical protein